MIHYSPLLKYSDLNARHIEKVERIIRSHGGDAMAEDWLEAAKAYNSQSTAYQERTRGVDYGEAFRIDIWYDDSREIINIECDAIQSGLFFECQALTASAKRVYS